MERDVFDTTEEEEKQDELDGVYMVLMKQEEKICHIPMSKHLLRHFIEERHDHCVRLFQNRFERYKKLIEVSAPKRIIEHDLDLAEGYWSDARMLEAIFPQLTYTACEETCGLPFWEEMEALMQQRNSVTFADLLKWVGKDRGSEDGV